MEHLKSAEGLLQTERAANQKCPGPLQYSRSCASTFLLLRKASGSTLDILHSLFSPGSRQHTRILTWSLGL